MNFNELVTKTMEKMDQAVEKADKAVDQAMEIANDPEKVEAIQFMAVEKAVELAEKGSEVATKTAEAADKFTQEATAVVTPMAKEFGAEAKKAMQETNKQFADVIKKISGGKGPKA